MAISNHVLIWILFIGLFVGLFSGLPVGFVLLGISIVVGVIGFGSPFFSMMMMRVFETMHNYVLVSIVLFIFMGIMLEKSGAGERLFSSMHVLFGRLRGGLAFATIIVSTIMAAATGIMGAPVIIMGLFALPEMLKRGYSKSLSCGTICAGGTLGILIPPSIMLVVYGPMAGLSVGKLFLGAVMPGLLLSFLYSIYVLILCHLKPEMGPAFETGEVVSFKKKCYLFFHSLMPTLFLILAVLGSIFFGIAAPTEAAAIGSFASILLAVLYGRFNLKILKHAILETTYISSMILTIVVGAFVFTGTFMLVGGGDYVAGMLFSISKNPWVVLFFMVLCFFIFGMFMEWVGIVPILVPIFTPIISQLGFDPLWAGILFCVAMQTSFLTPPMAPALFYLKGVAPKDVDFADHIVKGVIPFIIIQLISLIILAIFPEIVTFLPNRM
ncbi:TRAP transporter large permease subunit [Desulfothermus okinawensis JCM 13304]